MIAGLVFPVLFIVALTVWGPDERGKMPRFFRGVLLVLLFPVSLAFTRNDSGLRVLGYVATGVAVILALLI